MENVKTSFAALAKRTPGVLYEPVEKNEKQRIAVLVMHSDEDYLTFSTGPELAKRGYTVLCANVMNKEGIIFSQVEKTESVKHAVEYLRSLPAVEKIILMGHSGGGTLMSAYQAVAENGPQIFQGQEKVIPYPSEEELPPADGIMLLDSNWGNAAMQLFSLDAALEDEHSGVIINEELDLFHPDNGFDPKGSEYSLEFIKKYQAAQSARNSCIVDYALNRLLMLQNGKGHYVDDEPLIVPGSAQGFFNNKLYAQDIRLMSRTKDAYLLLHPDGTRTIEQIHSIRGPENPKSFTSSFWEGARFLSVKTYLTSYAVRTEKDYGYDEDHVWGIEWDSTYSCPPGNMTHINVPTLIMGMTAGWEFLASETIYKMAAAKDRTIAFVEGATHKFGPARHMEQWAGQFGDTEKTLYDFVDEWLSAGRF
ncbi:MAG: alpha/beta hydrolase [Lachnospiraceae bacterium]|nr:alpha/beta hydrolase [Lachnospiraceae bacterium]